MKTSSQLSALFSAVLTPAEIAANDQLALISAAIELWRVDHHMTQADFAKHMGVTQAMVSKWEYNFSVKTLAEISAKLGISLETLFCGNLEPRVYRTLDVVSSKTKVRAFDQRTTTYVKQTPAFNYEVIQGGAA